jgi:hypothetical protein
MSALPAANGGRGVAATWAARLEPFLPKSFICWREKYDTHQFMGDLSAGLTVAVIALPLSLALAVGAGVTPAACTRWRNFTRAAGGKARACCWRASTPSRSWR